MQVILGIVKGQIDCRKSSVDTQKYIHIRMSYCLSFGGRLFVVDYFIVNTIL